MSHKTPPNFTGKAEYRFPRNFYILTLPHFTIQKTKDYKMYKITTITYVTTSDYNDYIVGEDGRLQAQGSHDWHPQKFPQADKIAWHRIQRMRRKQHWTQRQRNTGECNVQRLAYARIRKGLYAINATVDTKTMEVIRCDGYTTRRSNRKGNRKTSRLGRLCNR